MIVLGQTVCKLLTDISDRELRLAHFVLLYQDLAEASVILLSFFLSYDNFDMAKYREIL